MKTSIYSLMIAATLSVTGIYNASANGVATMNSVKANNNAVAANSIGIRNSNVAGGGVAVLKRAGEPNFKGSENFAKAFPDAMVTSYETRDGRTNVAFSWNGDNLEAFYDLNGNLIATSHFIDIKSLPISIQMKIGDNYKDYTLSQAVEFYHSENGLSYFVMIKKAEKGLILQIDSNGGMDVVKKLKN